MTKDVAGLRSLLRIGPADTAGFEAALQSDADALILDLATNVEPGTGKLLQIAAKRFPRPMLLVQIHDLASADAALDTAMPGLPDGILLQVCGSGAEVQHLGVKLAVREAELGLRHGSTPILAMAGSSAAGLLGLSGFAGASPRLAALAWDAADLARDIGADPGLIERPQEAEPFRMAATMLLFGARAAGVAAIDTATQGDAAGLTAQCIRARSMGYTGKIAVHAAQVAIINAHFRRTSSGVA
jgi:citrate lyase subunit beta/citryl-CoA lyase